MILCSSYLVALFGIPTGPTFQPFGDIGVPISLSSLLISAGGILVMFVPSWLGIQMGARAATVLGLLAMTPLTLMVFLPFTKPSSIDWSNLSSLSLPASAGDRTAAYAAWIFIMIWSVFAMEAAACYIGECRDPHRDAKRALTAEGGFGFFIYAALPLMMVAVLGTASSADPMTVFLEYTEQILGSSAVARWLVGLMLVVALLLSVQNAIMGVGRSLYQISEDGMIPRWFAKLNRHGSPGNAMLFNVGCALAVLLFGSPLPIYVFSNIGYLLAIVLALGGYFVHRQFRPDLHRPFRLPAAARWVALGTCLALAVVLVYGGWQSPAHVVGAPDGRLFFIGFGVVALYVPLHAWRRWRDRAALSAATASAAAVTALHEANETLTTTPTTADAVEVGNEATVQES
jgi:amino acid transporter